MFRLPDRRAVAIFGSRTRDGARVARRPAVGLTTRELATMMIGDRSAQSAPRRSSRAGSDVLVALRGVRVGNTRGGVDLDVHAGEILAVTGLPGSGAEALVAMLAGDVPLPGTCRLGGKPVRISNARDAHRHGVGLIPEDHKGRGLVVGQSCAFNVSLASFGRVFPLRLAVAAVPAPSRRTLRDPLGIRMAAPDVPVATLSGGNQQKVMIAKLLASEVRVMAIEEPTQGVDIGGRARIHGLLGDFVDKGNAVLLYSTDLAEVLALADRIAVFRRGHLAELWPASELDERDLAA